MTWNRSTNFDYIEWKLNTLATSINSRGRLNILNYHIHSENFYAYFLNELYGWNLINANPYTPNIEAIDLIDNTKKLVIQVSATNSKAKVESSLNKKIIEKHSSYTFKFISIANDADELRTYIYKNPYGINFTPSNDIIDKNSIFKSILAFDIDDQRRIYELIRKELGSEIDPLKLDSNLAAILNLLAKENWTENPENNNHNPFDINKKIEHNKLRATSKIVREYSIFKTKVEGLYDEFDSLGSNKSYAVLQQISRFYIEEVRRDSDSDSIFLRICERVLGKVKESNNFIQVESDILILCVDILVVDAFIRCKIFENPDHK